MGAQEEAPRLSVDDILRVASFRDRDPAREAMVITALYNALARDNCGRLGGTVNWYGFAAWSSKTVSADLDLTVDSPFLATLRSRLGIPGRFRRSFRALTLLLLGPTYPLAIALANRAIFLETGSLAAGLWSDDRPHPGFRLCPPELSTADDTRYLFVATLLAPADDVYLERAITLFHEAAATADQGRQAELVLGANIALSAFEQARAQRLLELMMYRGCRWLMRVSWRWLWCAVTHRRFHRFDLYTAPHARMPWLVRHVETLWARFSTRFLMSLQTAVGDVRLGRPLRPPPGCDLEVAFAPIQDARVRKLVNEFVTDPQRARNGVADWLDYPERMRFITSYFRMYLRIPAMLKEPYAPDLMRELRQEAAAGTVPDPVYTDWFKKREQAYEADKEQPGVRGWITRNFYRPPIDCDPDAGDLARIDLGDFLIKVFFHGDAA